MDIQEVISSTLAFEELFKNRLHNYLKEDSPEMEVAHNAWASICNGLGQSIVEHHIIAALVRYQYRGTVNRKALTEAVCETLMDIGIAELLELKADYKYRDISFKNKPQFVSIKGGLYLYSPQYMVIPDYYMKEYTHLLESKFDSEELSIIKNTAKNNFVSRRIKGKFSDFKQ